MDNERLARLEEMVTRILRIVAPLERMGSDDIEELPAMVRAYRQGRADAEGKARFWRRIALGLAMVQGAADVVAVAASLSAHALRGLS